MIEAVNMSWTRAGLFAALLLGGPVLESAVAQPAIPTDLSPDARRAYAEKYRVAKTNKAFAITEDSRDFYLLAGAPTPARAALLASLRCLTAHKRPCQIWLVNDEEILPGYEDSRAASVRALARLPNGLRGRIFAGEDSDLKVAAPLTLRDGREGYHSATPLTAPTGARLLLTTDLVELYRAEKRLVAVDALDAASGPRRGTLPNALWLPGAGVSDRKHDDLVYSNLSRVMSALVPNEDTPVVAYCLGWECWLSWNAAARLVAMGYRNVYWYRGGLDSWKEAKLPLVQTPLTAQLY